MAGELNPFNRLKAPQGPRFCGKCGRPSGLRLCKECRKGFDANYYSDNREAKIQSATSIKRELQRWYFGLKDGKRCQAGGTGCSGGPYAACQLDFDHIPGRGQKILEVSKMVRNGWSRDKVEAEISKCQLICKNCHALRTRGRLLVKKG